MMVVLYSYIYVFTVIITATFLMRWRVLNDEGTRKFIHIGVGSWMIIVLQFFRDDPLVLIPPFTFIIINYLSYKLQLFKAMEREESSKNDLGTVYFAISLFVLLGVDFLLFKEMRVSALPLLILTFSDGLSAVIGQLIPSIKLYKNKTLIGTFTMFLVSLVVGSFFLLHVMWLWMIVAVTATILELYTPRGFDNITVPFGTYLLLLLWVI